jgi:hypothetical protein
MKKHIRRTEYVGFVGQNFDSGEKELRDMDGTITLEELFDDFLGSQCHIIITTIDDDNEL